MAKISELGSITGANTRSEDLLVIVNLVQGDDGTKNITRKELVEAIQYEIFSRITITGGSISGVVMRDSRLDNVEIDNSEIEDTDFLRGTIADTRIFDSTANNITMTYSSFNFGTLLNSTANNITITSSSFADGTGNNNIFNNTTLLDGSANNFVITDSSANNITITDSTANNIIITNSQFNEGTGNNVVLTNSIIDNSTFRDGTVNNSVIEQSDFNNGELADSTGTNIQLDDSSFADGTISTSIITDSEFLDGIANNVAITDSTFTSGDIFDSNANNVIITNSQFNDGTGNNVVLTNSTIDDSVFSDGTISNTTFTGTMDNVVATNMQIRSSSADGLGANNSTFENGGISQSTFSGGVIDTSKLVDFDMDLTKEFDPPMDDESYFAIKNEKTGDTEQINFGQLFDEISRRTSQALKIHVDAGSGNDDWPGSQMQPVRTLEKAFELCLEKAGGELNRNAINNSVHISVGPGTYYTKGNLALPDDCSMSSTAGQYATVIELEKGYENNNGILVGSGCYVQGFAYQNFQVDNFDYPEGGFAIAYRPGAKLLRSPYLRDSSQLSNFLRADVEPPLNPYNSKGTLADLGREFTLTNISDTTKFAIDDEIVFSSGAVGFVSYISEIASDSKIHVRNLKNNQGFAVGDVITSESGGTATISAIGIDDFPNREVGRGGGCVLADRRALDTDSLYTYVLCFGFTPRSQNGIGYVARDGAGVNGIGSLSIFVRCAFYALNGGQMTLNNSGTQFGDISMRAKGTTEFFAPKSTNATIIGNTVFADTIDDNADAIIDDVVEYLTANSVNGGLGYKEYDSEKCLRDAGIVLDGTGYDVALDTNYWGRLAGITYRSPISYVVPGEQLVETKGALEYLRDQTKNVFVSANAEINSRIQTSFAELLNVLEYGEENMNGIIWQDTSVARTAARTLLQDNKSFIADELIDWIENNDEFYAYDSAKCRRDVQDYILPAVTNDMQFDTNYNAVTAGRAYYMATAAKVVQQQNNETVAAYKRLKDQVNELIDGDSYLASERSDEAFEEILTILENSGTQFTPSNATYDPSNGLSVITLGTSKNFTPTDVDYDPTTGIMTATIGSHELTTDDHIWFKPEGITFTCNSDGNVTQLAAPQAHHPYYNKPCPIIGVTSNTITLNVGVGAGGVHTFVSSITNAFQSGHGLGKGRKVLLKQNGLVFTCSSDNNTTRHSYPRPTDPAAGSPIEVIGATPSKIVVNVGPGSGGTHTFVEALPNAVSALGSDIRWSDSTSISADKRNARKQLQKNREFLQELVLGYIDENYFRYNSDKCKRDIEEYIVPAVERDILTGTNYNAIQTGIAYRAGTVGTDIVLDDQLLETTGAINNLKDRLKINGGQSGFTVSNATYDPVTGIFTATVGADHGLVAGDFVNFVGEGITFECDSPAVQISHPRPTDPYYGKPVPITSVTATTITMNVGDAGGYAGAHTFVSAVANAIYPSMLRGLSYTPTTATYDPVNGRFEATIGSHDIQPGDYVEFAPESITWTCDSDGNVTQLASPQSHHPYYNHPCPVHSVTSTTIVCYVGPGQGGVHTFVSATANAISHVIGITDNSSEHRSDEAFDKIVGILNSSNKTYSTSTATYDPDTGLSVLTIGSHDLQLGDEIIIAPESLTFTCASDGNATQHTYPTTTITSFTPTAATYDPSTGIFTATIGAHKLKVGDFIEIAQESIVFSCDSDNNATELAAPQPHHPFYKKKIALTDVTGTTITCNVGTGSGGVHTFVSAVSGAITGERQHPAYKKPVVVAAKTATTVTVNVGTGAGGAHTFVSATPNNIKTAEYISTYTPTAATYDAATGEFVATIGQHNLVAGDYIEIKPESVVFTCDSDGNATEHAYPQSHHPAYKTPVRILSVTTDTITTNVGVGAGGTHTFVRADVGAIDSDALVFTDPASHIQHYTPTTATYDPVTGISVVTIPGHNLTTSDWIQFAPYSFTFTCSSDGNATEHSYPRKGDGNYNTPMQITNVAGDDITVNVGVGAGGAHTFVTVEKHAVTKLSYNSQGQYAREQLQANKDFLAAEVNAWIDDNYFVFDGAKCSRDTGLILDAVRRDVASGSNYHAVFNGLSYRLGGAGAQLVYQTQLTETVAAINYLKDKAAAESAITGTALTRSNAAFDEIIDILQNSETAADAISFGSNSVSANHTIARQILQLNKAFMQAEVTAFIAQQFPTLTYDVAKCERDTGYLVDAISWDIQHGSNTAAVNFARMYYDNAIAVLPEEQILPTAKTWEHIANVAYDIVRDVAVTPTTGNGASQNQSLTDAGLEVGESVRAGINITTQVIRDKNRDHLPAYIEPIVETGMESAVSVLDGITENLQLSVIDYLRQEHNGLPYSKAKCTRDVGLIVDAVSRDIEYGGNENTVEIFEYYFKRFNTTSADYEQLRSTNVLPVEVRGQFKTLSEYQDTANVSGLREAINTLPYEQRIPTKLAFAHLADVAEKIVKEVAHTPTSGNALTQDTTGTPADVATGTAVHDLINSIAELVDNVNIEEAEMPTVVKATFDPNRTLARKQLQRNRQFIIEEVNGYIHDRWFAFDGDLCKRDIGLILDAVANDVLTGSNFNSIFNGLAYRAGTTSTDSVINEELSETVKAIEYTRDLAVAAVTDAAMKQRTLDSFNEIIDIMTNGSAAADVIDYTAVSPSFNRLNARNQLQNNRTFLIAEMTAWLAANRPSLTYDVAKCERDVGYLIDAVSFDAQMGGNFATINDARLYFENAVDSVLPVDQRQPTADAFAHIAACAELICLDTDIGGLKSVGNAETQNFTAGSAGAATAAEVESLINIVANSIVNNTLLMNPVKEGPNASSFNAVNAGAYNQILGIKTTAQDGVISHLSKFFEVLPYNEAKCKRDVGYIVDAISHDIQYGGNAATVNTVNMYFTNGINTGLPIEQRLKTKDAYLHLAKIVEHVVGAKSITTTEFPREKTYWTGDRLLANEYWNGIPSYQTIETQDFAVHGANPDTCMAARQLVEIIANGVDDAYEVKNTIPERIDVLQTWMGDNYIASKELVERQADTYSEGVINYISAVHNGLSFPEAKCRRDIGYLIDAASHDVQHDTNYATRIVTQIYFENGISVLPAATRTQTADVYQFLGDAVEQVVQEIPVTNASTYTLLQQNTAGTAATATEGTRVHDLIGYVETAIRENDLDQLPALSSTATWPAAELTAAAITIDDNSEELASDVTEYINNNFNVLDYNKAKCRRDVGYLLDAFSFDLNFGGNTASRWNADFYFWNQIYRLPEDQRIPTAKSYRHLGKICKDIVIGEYPGQVILGELGTEEESNKVVKLADIFYKTQLYNDTKYLPIKEEPDYTYSQGTFTDAQNIIGQRRKDLQKDTVRFVNSSYDFIDINLTRRDARNLLTAVMNDFKFEDLQVSSPSYTTNGNQNAVRTFTSSLFNYDGTHVFPVFNPSISGLKYKGSVNDVADLASLTGMKPNWAYIVATDYSTNYYAGDIYYWNGIQFVNAGANDTSLLDAFTGAWDRMRTYLVNNLSPDGDHSAMIEGLFNDCLKDNVLRPNTLTFGSLVESIAHQFNGASAGVNRNALPLNFRNLGQPISAIASVLNEDGGRIRWSGADELNNQYFARGLRINGRTGRIEGRPFTSSVRKLARRASNSRAVV